MSRPFGRLTEVGNLRRPGTSRGRFERFIGMLAIALWDREQRTLTLMRDQVGIEPFYYGRFDDLVLFRLQPRSLAEHPAWRGELDRDSLAAY